MTVSCMSALSLVLDLPAVLFMMNKYTKCFHIISLIEDAPPVGYSTVSQRLNNNIT